MTDSNLTVSKRRVMRSLLPRIRQLHDEETYRYAERLFDKMDELDEEIKKKEEEHDACNKVLTRLVFMTSKSELW